MIGCSQGLLQIRFYKQTTKGESLNIVLTTQYKPIVYLSGMQGLHKLHTGAR